ncbi:hypothetical protein GCM10009647_082260 [Streptomyces sanglieri]
MACTADYWIGVTSLWRRPSRQDPTVTVLAEDASGRPLPEGWHERWLDVMRAHKWHVRWRIAPGVSFEDQFSPYDDHECAGVILLGERVQRPGARAADYLAGVSTSIPVAAPAVPFVPDVDTSSPAEREAYARLAADLFG